MAYHHKLVCVSILSCLALSLVSGCGTTPGSPKAIAKEKAEIKKAQEEAVKSNLEEMPDWMAKTPQDPNLIFASGTDTSKDMQLAMDKASMAARRELALAIGGRVSTMMKQYAEEAGVSADPDVVEEVRRTTSEEAIDVSLVGQQRADAKVIREGASYRAFVLIRYPIGELNKLAVQTVKQNAVLDAKLRSGQAFQELERKVQESKNN